MITWVIFLAVGILVGIGVGLYISRLDDAAKRTQHSLTQQIEDKNKEIAAYKAQVNSHFITTAELVNNMTTSYRAVHEHLSSGVKNLCMDATEVNSIPFAEKKMIAGEGEAAAQEQANAPDTAVPDATIPDTTAPDSTTVTAESTLNVEASEPAEIGPVPVVEASSEPEATENLQLSDSEQAGASDNANAEPNEDSNADKQAAEPAISDVEQSRINASRMVH